MRHTGTIVAITALLAVALAPVASAQVISNSSFPLVVGPYFQMRNSADNSFCQSYFLRVPARTYYNFNWCQTNANGLGMIYSDADTIPALAAGAAPSTLPACRKVDDLRSFALDYQFLANDMPRAAPDVNAWDSVCSTPKLFPTTCYNQDATVFISISNYWSGKFANGTLYPSSWYGTRAPRDLNVTLTPVPAEGQAACKDVGSFTTLTRTASATRGPIPTPKIEGAEGAPTISSQQPTKSAAAGAQLGAAAALAVVAAVAGSIALF